MGGLQNQAQLVESTVTLPNSKSVFSTLFTDVILLFKGMMA